MTLWLCNKIFIKTTIHCSPLATPHLQLLTCWDQSTGQGEKPTKEDWKVAWRLTACLASPVNIQHLPAVSAEAGALSQDLSQSWDLSLGPPTGLPGGSVFLVLVTASAACPPPELLLCSVERWSTQGRGLHLFHSGKWPSVSRYLDHAVSRSGVWFLTGRESLFLLFFCEVLTCHSNCKDICK